MKRHPLERIVRLLACKLTGHRYVVAREFGGARKVTCSRCSAVWAMHDATRSFLPWDADFEQLYAPGGVLHEQASGSTAACQWPVAPRHEPTQAMAHCSSAGNDAQKAFDEAVAEIKETPPWNSHWHRSAKTAAEE